MTKFNPVIVEHNNSLHLSINGILSVENTDDNKAILKRYALEIGRLLDTQVKFIHSDCPKCPVDSLDT